MTKWDTPALAARMDAVDTTPYQHEPGRRRGPKPGTRMPRGDRRARMEALEAEMRAKYANVQGRRREVEESL